MTLRTLLAVGATALVAAACSDAPDPVVPDLATAEARKARGFEKAAPAASHTYEITIENLTSGQPFSPGVVAIHTNRVSLLELGEPVSEGIRLIAENGDPTTALAEAGAAFGVNDFASPDGPVGCVGCSGPPEMDPFPTTRTLTLEAAANANRLSLALMLICTNDGVVGLNSVRLPGGFEPATFMARAYDAGTEANDETSGSIVPPCGVIGPVPGAIGAGNTRNATSGVLAPHPGIQGIADLTVADHGWTGPVARVTVQRMR